MEFHGLEFLDAGFGNNVSVIRTHFAFVCL